MSDPILLATSDNEFEKMVANTLRNSRKESWKALAKSPLAQTSLVESCLGPDDANDDKLRARVVQGVLHWGIEQLRPAGKHSWTDNHWNHYNVLFYLYIEPMSFDDLAKEIAIAKTTLFKRRSKAVHELSQTLRQALEREPCENDIIVIPYFLLRNLEQRLLRLAVIFRQPFSSKWLHELAQESNIPNIPTTINNLIKANFLISLDEGTQFEAHPDIRSHLLPMLWPKERQNWHWTVAELYLAQMDYLEAAYHFQRTGDPQGDESAAQTLIDNQQAIIDKGQTNELRHMLTEFKPHQLSADLWPCVKIAAGDVALLLGEVKTALAEYSLALNAPQVHTKALAYYKRGRAIKLINLDEAITHFERGIELLQPLRQPPPLLPDLYLDIVWLYLQDRLSLQKAENYLKKAQTVILRGDSRRRANLHNAWAKLCQKKGHEEGEREHYLKALSMARETQDSDLIINTAHNVGDTYIWQGEYNQGRAYLQEALELAIQTGDKSKQGSCYKTIGASYFFQAEYDKAITHYQRAYDIFVKIGNRNWLGDVCHDLAEAHAENWNKSQMEKRLQEATKIAQELQDEQLLADLKKLTEKYSSRMKVRDRRQWQGINYIISHGQITNREYQKLIDVPKATATRHLRNLCKKGFLVKEGRGPATYYTLTNHA